MRTIISLPDELYEDAEAETKRLRISRSRLYSMALSEYLSRRRSANITAKLNEVYSKAGSRLPKGVRELQGRAVFRNSW